MNLNFGDKIIIKSKENNYEGVFLKEIKEGESWVVLKDGISYVVDDRMIHFQDESIQALPFGVRRNHVETHYAIDYKKFAPGSFVHVIRGNEEIVGTVIESNVDQIMVSYYDKTKNGINSLFVRWQDLMLVNGQARMSIKTAFVQGLAV